MSVSRVIKLALLLLLLPTGKELLSQEAGIAGRVTDENGQAVSGAAVTIRGTDLGTLTDAAGMYAISLSPGNYQVEVRIIGFATAVRSAVVGAGTVTLNIQLTPQAIQMDELVASVGAEDARRVERGTDVVVLDADELVAKSSAENISDLLSARATGVQITEASGGVGSGSLIRVRGATSLTQDNVPLLYVDGIRVSNKTGTGPRSRQFPETQTISRFDDLNPNDVASIQVLKGPSATALYGAEAASGVLLIETKRAESEEASFHFVMEQGLNIDQNQYPTTYVNLTSVAGITDPNRPALQPWDPILQPVTGDVLAQFNPLEDPRTEPFQNGRISRYHLSVAETFGGEASLYASGKVDMLNGALEPQTVDRLSVRANFDAQLSDDLRLSVSSNYIDGTIGVSSGDRNTTGWITNGAAAFPLFSYAPTPQGCLATIVLELSPSSCIQRGNFIAPFGELTDKRQKQDVERVIGSATLQYAPIDWWSNRLTAGVDLVQTTDVNLIIPDPDLPFGGTSRGIRDHVVTEDRIITVDLASTASFRLLSDLTSSTSVGTQGFFNRSDVVACSASVFVSESATACHAGLTFEGFNSFAEIREVGAFVQQELGFREYLFLTGSLRVDDSSAFGDAQGAIWSPSANLSVLLSDMPFWNVGFVDDFRVRAAWGKAAQAPDPFAARRTFRPTRVIRNGEQVLGVSPLDPGNPNLTAERSEEFELGFDASVFDGRLGATFTYYNARVSDAIFPTRVAPSTGFSGVQFINIGAVENEGFEVQVSGLLLNEENFRWHAALQLSTVSPVIASLGGADPILGCTTTIGSSSGIFVEGLPPGTYCGNVVSEATRDGQGNIDPGSVVVAPGNIPVLQGTGLRNLGQQTPTNTESLSTTITLFNNLQIYTVVDRKAGFSKFWSGGGFMNPFIRGESFYRRWAFRFTESTPEEQEMMDREGDFNQSVFIQDGTFIRWRELSLNYDLPADVVGLLGWVKGASVQIGVKNLGVITDYEGIDPEAQVFGATDNFNNAEFLTQGPVTKYSARLSIVF